MTIDFIPVDRRYCWEPLCSEDTAMYIDAKGNRLERIVKTQAEVDLHDWTALLLFDSRGQRCIVYFNETLPIWVAIKVLVRELDKNARNLTISGITSIIGHDDA